MINIKNLRENIEKTAVAEEAVSEEATEASDADSDAAEEIVPRGLAPNSSQDVRSSP